MDSVMASKSLQIERHPPFTLRKWYSRRNDINFSPPYQRKGGIWSEYDRGLLIDTIINGLDIPKFYLSDFARRSSELEEGHFVYAIIDGKQRMEAIFDFMSDRLPLNKDFKWRFEPSLELGGFFYSDLEDRYPHLASKIDEYVIDVISVTTDDPEDINRIFKRLNKGKALAGAEVRNAALGPVADMIRVVGRHEFFQQSVSFNTLRYGDLNAAGKILLFEFQGFPTSTKKKDLDSFVDQKELDADRVESAGLKCLSHLEFMFQAFREKDSLLRSAGQVPVYYWVIRLIPRESLNYVRAYFYQFDQRRARNRKLQTEGRLADVDAILSRYDALNRNTNDSGSHRARISILLSGFSEWLENEGFGSQLAREVYTAFERYDKEMKSRKLGFDLD